MFRPVIVATHLVPFFRAPVLLDEPDDAPVLLLDVVENGAPQPQEGSPELFGTALDGLQASDQVVGFRLLGETIVEHLVV